MIFKKSKDIPEDMIVVKTKNKYKFYYVNLERLNTIILEEGVASIQKAK